MRDLKSSHAEATQPNDSVFPLVQPKSAIDNKTFVVILVLALTIVLICGIFILAAEKFKTSSQISKSSIASTKISGWKTFNNFYGATFQYPPEWSIDPEFLTKVNRMVEIQDTSYTGKDCRGDCSTFTITFLVSDNPRDYTLVDFIKNDYMNSGNPQYLAPLKIEDSVIGDGLPCKMVTGIFNGLEYFYIQHNNKIYTISAFAGTNGTSDNINDQKVQARLIMLKKVLSTFQFH